MARIKPIKILTYLFVLAMALFFITPMVYTLISSLKPIDEIFEFPVRWIPRHIRLQNFVDPFVHRNFGIYFFNSTFAAVATTVSSLFLSSLAGYSLAKFHYRGRGLLFILVLMTMMLPIQVTMVPLAIIVRYLGMMNTYWGLIAPLMVTPFAIFWMRQFILTLPNDYGDAARIDGLGEFGIFIRVILPLCGPALGALAIFSFMSNWNSLVWPMIVASRDSLRTIPLGIVQFQGEFEVIWNELFAMSVASVVPALIFFVILKGRLIKGLAMVGIKQ
jgi:ABC-type glycerol-3-phosphate transport system permease component